MSSHSPITQKFKEALLGGLPEIKIGEFWILKEGMGISILNEELYKARKNVKKPGDWKKFEKKNDSLRPAIRTWTPSKINNKDLPEWLQ